MGIPVINEDNGSFPCWRRLFVAMSEIHNSVAVADGLHMERRTLAQTRTFEVIAESWPAGISLSELAERRRITPGTASLSVDALVAVGLVERAPSLVGDRRKIRLLLTAKALEHIRKIEGIADTLFAEAFSGVPDADRRAFLRVLEKVEENLALKKQKEKDARRTARSMKKNSSRKASPSVSGRAS